ncbi:MAG TPA: hypothetical protein VEW48_02785 [Thermoanaerobaculia bacterium]|nr:hypothetical protein [Thermoanaerobaculia bacterium]
MKRSTLIPLAALTLALSVSSALPAAAQDRYGRYDDRYDSRDNTRNVSAVAYEIEQTAYSMRREAERNNRRPDRWEARMLSALRDLNQEAAQFRAQVEGGRRYGSGRSNRELEDLVRAFRETGNVLDRVDQRPYIDRGMDRIGSLLTELSRYYGRRGDYRYDRHGSGRYGRDGGYDRDDRWEDDHH